MIAVGGKGAILIEGLHYSVEKNRNATKSNCKGMTKTKVETRAWPFSVCKKGRREKGDDARKMICLGH